MNIIKRELRANMKSLIIWSSIIVVFVVMMMYEFSAYYNNPEMSAVLDSMPKALLDAFSMGSANLTTVSGYLSIAAVYFSLMLGIFAVLLGSSIISKEERDKTVEFFLALPISRQRILVSKLIAAIINCIIINIVTVLAILITTIRYEKIANFNKFFALLMLGIFIIQMIFLSIGMFLAAIMKRYKKSGTYSISILLALYFFSIFVSLSEKMEFFKYITPFKFFEAQNILNQGKLDGTYLLISLGIIVFAMIGTFVFYPKRDLHI